jgi:hypothetical protein
MGCTSTKVTILTPDGELHDQQVSYKPNDYVKLTNETCCHNGFQFKEGLNIDTVEFNEEPICGAGGLYFCKFSEIAHWMNYNKDVGVMMYIWKVEIPTGEKVIEIGNKYKAHRIILSHKRPIWHTKQLCEDAVLKDHSLFKLAQVHTYKMFEEVIKYDPLMLEHMRIPQKREICELAVGRNGLALKFVKKQDIELCMKAVENDGFALEWVKDKTPEICKVAIKNNAHSIQFIENPNKELCILAIHCDGGFCNTLKIRHLNFAGKQFGETITHLNMFLIIYRIEKCNIM